MFNLHEQPVAIDLFAGAGGLSEGMLSAGVNVTVAVELHPHPALTNAFNHPGTTVLCGDIKDLDPKVILSHVQRNTGNRHVDIVAGGPPCQGFSSAGKRDSKDPRNQLIHQFVRIVEAFEPKVFIFENVPGLGTFYGGATLHKVLDKFWELGYQIHGVDNEGDSYPLEYPVVDSSCFGVPQRRKRLILIGWKKGALGKLEWPTTADDPRYSAKSKLTVYDAISDLDFLSGGFECHQYQSPAASKYQRERRKNSEFVFNHLATKHHVDTVNMFRRFRAGTTVSSLQAEHRTGKQRVRRLSTDETAPAVLALPDDYIHPRRHRIPTVRELARLQSFDDDYVFFGKRTTSDMNRRLDVPQYTQVGNAVPPLLARRLAEAILKGLEANVVDLRPLRERKSRHSWVVGSSAFQGYELTEAATAQVDVVSLRDGITYLPIGSIESWLGNGNLGIVNWTKRRKISRKTG